MSTDLTKAEKHDRDLHAALEASLWHAKGFWDESVVEDEHVSGGERVSKKGLRKKTICRTRSTVTGEDAYVVHAGNARYLYADKETVRTAFERWGLPDDPERYIQGGSEDKGWTTVKYSAATAGTTSSQYAAWVARETGQDVDWGYGPTGDGPDLDEVLARDVEDEVRPTKEEGESIARRVTERLRDETGIKHSDFRVKYSGSYHSEGYRVRAGAASFGGAKVTDDEETVFEKCLSVAEAQKGAIAFYAGPSDARGSTGEPYFQEEG
jgi:hypothetical protein